MSEVVKKAVRDGVAVLTLNRPATRNAIDLELRVVLAEAIEGAMADDAVRVIVIRAEGKGFCAGVDIKELQAHPDRIIEVNFVRRHSSRAANECRFHSDHDAPDKTLWLAGVSSAGRIGCGVR